MRTILGRAVMPAIPGRRNAWNRSLGNAPDAGGNRAEPVDALL
jgi:hypothetical protein